MQADKTKVFVFTSKFCLSPLNVSTDALLHVVLKNFHPLIKGSPRKPGKGEKQDHTAMF